MAGCFGNDPYDKYVERQLFSYLKEQDADDKRDEKIEQRANDKFMALPDLYRSRDGSYRWTNMEDAQNGLKQQEWIEIARALRDGNNLLAGDLLSKSIRRVLTEESEEEIDDEAESFKEMSCYGGEE